MNPALRRCWHPVAYGADLGPGPRAATLLGERLALWRDSRGAAHAFRDLCVHRGTALSLGSVQMLAPSLAKFGPLGVREFEVFDLPYVFDNAAELHKVTEGPVGTMLFKKLEGKGITGLAYWDNGFKVMSANKPLRNPEDMKGLKMRIQSSNVLDAQMRSVGALPQKMAFSEVYQAF